MPVRHRALISAILYLLLPAGACLHRRYIEDHLYSTMGAQGAEVTEALKRVVIKNQAIQTSLKIARGVNEHVYSKRPLGATKIQMVEHQIHQRNDALDPAVLGKTCEIYVRQLFVRANVFASIPQRRFLGRSGRRHGAPVDLIVRYKDSSILAMPIVCEVKNTHERFYPGSVIFGQLIKKALDQCGQPVLCVAHLSPEALVFCEVVGIGVLHLGRQIAPFSLRHKIKAMSGLIGAPRFEFLKVAKPLQPVSHEKARDLSIVSTPDWLTMAAGRWVFMKDVFREHYDALNNKKRWRTVLRKIQRCIVLSDDPGSRAGRRSPRMTMPRAV